mmetsp:Transcript_40569/g.160885  ORF Transcript_40569/g.160885 Transcript_40569/m.160885 type:complete len:138 (+) Transcript_40569:696-1109(+)
MDSLNLRWRTERLGEDGIAGDGQDYVSRDSPKSAVKKGRAALDSSTYHKTLRSFLDILIHRRGPHRMNLEQQQQKRPFRTFFYIRSRPVWRDEPQDGCTVPLEAFPRRILPSFSPVSTGRLPNQSRLLLLPESSDGP